MASAGCCRRSFLCGKCPVSDPALKKASWRVQIWVVAIVAELVGAICGWFGYVQAAVAVVGVDDWRRHGGRISLCSNGLTEIT